MVFDPASIALSIGTSIAKKAILGGGKSAQPRMSVPQLKQFSSKIQRKLAERGLG